MRYRREINGLRALAIIPVILFHAGFTMFSGGFIGVDIFFVISGYLITSIIMLDLDDNHFSIFRFYERRARRILPALFLVLLCCVPFAFLWMLPTQLKNFSTGLMSVIFFGSNILFWRQEGYFTPTSELNPILHTWSLGVEEQYYVLFPILLSIFWRVGHRRLLTAIIAVAVMSLALSEWGTHATPSANFYLLPSRAWELLSGSICAFLSIGHAERRSNILSLAGIALIAFSIFYFDKSTPTPGLYAVLPVLGTALIILFAGPETVARRVLGTPILVNIGLVSYSAYLWHQPLFAFARIRSITEPAQSTMILLSVASLMLAYLSWKFVEQPFRSGGAITKIPTIALMVTTSLAILAIGMIGFKYDGFERRMPQKYERIKSSSASFGQEFESSQKVMTPIGSRNRPPSLAIIGDSHAARYAHWLDMHLKQSGAAGLAISASWCPPLLNFGTDDASKNAPICNGQFQKDLANTIADPFIKKIILSAQWANYTTGFRFGTKTSIYRYGDHSSSSPSNNPANFNEALAHTVDVIHTYGKILVIIGPIPDYQFPVYDAVQGTVFLNRDIRNLRLTRTAYEARNADVMSAFSRLPKTFTYVDMSNVFCDTQWCYPYDRDGFPLYEDFSHLSLRGLNRSSPLLQSILK